MRSRLARHLTSILEEPGAQEASPRAALLESAAAVEALEDTAAEFRSLELR